MKIFVPGMPRFIAPEGDEPNGLLEWLAEAPQPGSAAAGHPPPLWFQEGAHTGALLDQLAGLELGKEGLLRPFTSENIPFDLGIGDAGGTAAARTVEKNWGWELVSGGPGPTERS